MGQNHFTLIENVVQRGLTVSYLSLVSQELLLEWFHLLHQSRQDLHYNRTRNILFKKCIYLRNEFKKIFLIKEL